MPIRWNVPQHAAAQERLDAALDEGVRPGAVVLGPDGCGKSTLARVAAEGYARAEAAPEAIAALWSDALLERIDVDAPGGATPASVDAFIAELPAAARSVLDYLAVAEPLSLADLTILAGDGAVTEAADWGAAETRGRGGRSDDPVVYTAHPLFAERALAALGADDARRHRAEVVKLLSQHPSDHLSDRLRLASLALDSDAPQPVADVAGAARQALRLGDLALG